MYVWPQIFSVTLIWWEIDLLSACIRSQLQFASFTSGFILTTALQLDLCAFLAYVLEV